jgi:putative FmdB family regulatory protein
MPTYEYTTVGDGCIYCRDGFEMRQSIRSAALRKCPECGGPIRKVLRNFAHYTARPAFSYDRAANAGFTSYARTGEGLQKIAGPGPDMPATGPEGLP